MKDILHTPVLGTSLETVLVVCSFIVVSLCITMIVHEIRKHRNRDELKTRRRAIPERDFDDAMLAARLCEKDSTPAKFG